MRERIVLLLIIFVFSCFAFYAPSAQAIEFYHPRAFALGGAYTGLADDYSAIYYNPAGLAHSGILGFGLGVAAGGQADNAREFVQNISQILDDPGIILNNGEITDLEADYNGLVGLRFGPVGGGLTLKGQAWTDSDNEEAHSKNILGYNLGFAHQILDPFADIGAISVGFNARYLQGSHISVEEIGAEPEEIRGTGYAADIGLLVRLTEMVNLGVKVDNAISSFEWDDSIENEIFDRTLTVGAGINLPLVGLTATADLSTVLGNDGSAFRAGVEKRFLLGLIAFRAGLAQEFGEARYYTGGMGVNLGFLQADLGIGVEGLNLNKPSAVLGVSANF